LLYHPKKNLGGAGDKHLPQSPFTGQFLEKAENKDYLGKTWRIRETKAKLSLLEHYTVIKFIDP
jgi:hypothetical protein